MVDLIFEDGKEALATQLVMVLGAFNDCPVFVTANAGSRRHFGPVCVGKRKFRASSPKVFVCLNICFTRDVKCLQMSMMIVPRRRKWLTDGFLDVNFVQTANIFFGAKGLQ